MFDILSSAQRLVHGADVVGILGYDVFLLCVMALTALFLFLLTHALSVECLLALLEAEF